MSLNANIASALAGGKKLQACALVGGAVEVAVGDGFHDVVVEDVGAGLEVGDGAGDFEDAVVGPCAHVHAFHGVAKLFQAGGIGLGVFVQEGRGHLGVAVDAGFVLEAALLEHPSSDDALADGGAGLARGLGRHLVKIDGLDLNLQVNAVQQRARNLAHVVGALILVADALLLGMPIVPARARIHRSHEHKRGGVFGAVFRPTDTYYPVLQRLTHHLQHTSIEFRQLIQAEELAPLP